MIRARTLTKPRSRSSGWRRGSTTTNSTTFERTRRWSRSTSARARSPTRSLLDAAILSDGSVTLGESLGLTCATFLLALFDAAQVKLLALGSWDTDRTAERCDEDEAAQRQIVLHLRSHDPGHARLVEQDVGCTRVRAEEVAAASGMTERPADFARVEPEGRSVLSRLWR